MKNTRILVRLAAMVAVLLVLMAAIAVIGIRGMATVQEGLRTVYEDRVVPLEQISSIESDYYNVRIAVVDAVGARDTAIIAKDAADIAKRVEQAQAMWKAYLAT